MRTLTCRVRRRGWRGCRPRRWSPREMHELVVVYSSLAVGLFFRPRVGYLPCWTSRDAWPYTSKSLLPCPEWNVKKKTVGQVSTSASGVKHLAPLESDVLGRLHALVAHCGVTRYDDGDPRRPGWFTVSTLGSAWKVVVKDPDGCCQLSAVANTLDDALALADLLVSSEEAPWEPDPFLKRMGTKKSS